MTHQSWIVQYSVFKHCVITAVNLCEFSKDFGISKRVLDQQLPVFSLEITIKG